MAKDKKEILEEGKEVDFETFMETTEEVLDELAEEDKLKVVIIGSEFVRITQGDKFLQVKFRMSYGDKSKVKEANKPSSYVYNEENESIEMKLKNEDADLFILERQITETDFGKVDRETIKNNETHGKLFEAALDIIKLKNGLVQTKKQLKKNKKKKKA